MYRILRYLSVALCHSILTFLRYQICHIQGSGKIRSSKPYVKSLWIWSSLAIISKDNYHEMHLGRRSGNDLITYIYICFGSNSFTQNNRKYYNFGSYGAFLYQQLQFHGLISCIWHTHCRDKFFVSISVCKEKSFDMLFHTLMWIN